MGPPARKLCSEVLMVEKIDWLAIRARWRAAEQRFEGSRAFRRAAVAFVQGAVLDAHLQFYKALKHYEAATKFDECAAAGRSGLNSTR